MHKKYAVLGMDIEDWYHLDYFDKEKCDQSESTLDGINIYLDILDTYNIKTTFFVVGELVEKLKGTLKQIISQGHEIALHSYSHRRPLTMSIDEYKQDTSKNIKGIHDILGYTAIGYRAPCFSMDRERLEILKDLNLYYDASHIKFSDHKLYGHLDLTGFTPVRNDILKRNDFFEFETSTLPLKNKNIPISGGGYLRIFPWMLTKYLLNRYVKLNKNYFFYIHPFEFSKNYNITSPSGTSFATNLRFRLGRKSVEKKMHRLIKLLKGHQYEFVRFEDLVNKQGA